MRRRDAMERRIREAVAGFPGTVSLYARNLDGGAEFGIHADERVRTASTIKLPILGGAICGTRRGLLVEGLAK